MSTPAAKVRFRMSNGATGSAADPRVVEDYARKAGLTVEWGESGPAAGIRRMPAAEPETPEFIGYKQPLEVGQAETALRSGVEGATLGAAPHVAGAVNMLSASRDLPPGEPIQQPTEQGPAVARAGMGGMPSASPPLVKAYQEGRDEYRERTAAGEEQNPGTALLSRVAGSAIPSALIPPIRAAQGAGMVGRAVAGAGNVAGDAALAGAAGLAESDGDPDAALEAAAGGGAASAAMRGLAAAPGGLLRGARSTALGAARLRGAMTPGASDDILSFTRDRKPVTGPLKVDIGEPRTSGAEARRAANDGADMDAAARSMTGDLRKMEGVRDAVQSESGVGLKPKVLAPKFAATEALANVRGKHGAEMAQLKVAPGMADPAAVYVNSQPLVDATMAEVERIGTEGGRIRGLGGGYNALERVKKAAQAYAQRAESAPAGAEGVAHIYSALDQFKREVGNATKAATGGPNPDKGVADALASQYETLRQHLVDPETWGDDAVRFQNEVNAAWEAQIPALKSFGKRFGSSVERERSAGNPFSEYRPVGSENVAGFLSQAGSAGADDAEKSLRNYISGAPKLMDTLAANYEVRPELAAQIPEAKAAAGRIGQTLDKTIESADAARRLGNIREKAPPVAGIPLTSPADLIGMVGKAEAAAERMGLPKAERVLGQAAGIGARTTGISGATAQKPQPAPIGSDLVARAAVEQPQSLGKNGPLLLKALQEGGKDRMRAFHMTLMQTDPEYQQLVRGLSGDTE